MVPLVVYFAGSLFGETGCQVMLERIFFNPGQLIFSLSSKKCLNCYNMWGHVWENIIFILYIVSTFGCFGKIPSIFWISNEEPCSIWLISIPLNFLVLKRSIPPQYLWSSLQGLSFIKQQIVQMTDEKSFRWDWFTYCTEFSSSVVREISHGSPISVRGPLQRRDRVEKVCLPCFGQRKMNIWKEHLSCG